MCEQIAQAVAFYSKKCIGISIKTGLDHVSGDKKLYMKVLGNVHRRFRDVAEQIQAEVEQGDLIAAHRLAHTFKGIAGTIGADTLHKCSFDLESALAKSETDKIPDLIAFLSTEVKRVMTGLETLFPKIPETDNKKSHGIQEVGVPDKESLRKIFEELSDLIEEGDSDALDRVAMLRDMLGASRMTDDIRLLESQIDEYEFEEAQETFRRICKEMNFQQSENFPGECKNERSEIFAYNRIS